MEFRTWFATGDDVQVIAVVRLPGWRRAYRPGKNGRIDTTVLNWWFEDTDALESSGGPRNDRRCLPDIDIETT
jgi:hypothetical protein